MLPQLLYRLDLTLLDYVFQPLSVLVTDYLGVRNYTVTKLFLTFGAALLIGVVISNFVMYRVFDPLDAIMVTLFIIWPTWKLTTRYESQGLTALPPNFRWPAPGTPEARVVFWRRCFLAIFIGTYVLAACLKLFAMAALAYMFWTHGTIPDTPAVQPNNEKVAYFIASQRLLLAIPLLEISLYFLSATPRTPKERRGRSLRPA